MSVKTFTFRYDSDSDIGKWMASQGKKNESLELAIQTLIGNFDYQDLREVIPRQVPLEIEAVKPQRKRKAPKPRKTSIKKRTKVVKMQQPPKEELKQEKTKDDKDNSLDMFSSL